VVVEFLFNWPGVGRLIYEAIHGQDVPLLVGAFLISSVLVVLGNLLADVCAALLDPRTRQTTPGSLT
jgi:peptide/nickel transport system permease protein